MAHVVLSSLGDAKNFLDCVFVCFYNLKVRLNTYMESSILKGCFVTYQCKRLINLLGREITSLSTNVEKAVFHGGGYHLLPHRCVQGVGDVNHGELNRCF